MPSKLEILGQVMLSLKGDQNDVMNNINSLLNNKDKEVNLINNIKSNIRKLAFIHIEMEETQSFILQLTQNEIKKSEETGEELKSEKASEIGSSGIFNDKENKEKSGK